MLSKSTPIAFQTAQVDADFASGPGSAQTWCNLCPVPWVSVWVCSSAHTSAWTFASGALFGSKFQLRCSSTCGSINPQSPQAVSYTLGGPYVDATFGEVRRALSPKGTHVFAKSPAPWMFFQGIPTAWQFLRWRDPTNHGLSALYYEPCEFWHMLLMGVVNMSLNFC